MTERRIGGAHATGGRSPVAPRPDDLQRPPQLQVDSSASGHDARSSFEPGSSSGLRPPQVPPPRALVRGLPLPAVLRPSAPIFEPGHDLVPPELQSASRVQDVQRIEAQGIEAVGRNLSKLQEGVRGIAAASHPPWNSVISHWSARNDADTAINDLYDQYLDGSHDFRWFKTEAEKVLRSKGLVSFVDRIIKLYADHAQAQKLLPFLEAKEVQWQAAIAVEQLFRQIGTAQGKDFAWFAREARASLHANGLQDTVHQVLANYQVLAGRQAEEAANAQRDIALAQNLAALHLRPRQKNPIGSYLGADVPIPVDSHEQVSLQRAAADVRGIERGKNYTDHKEVIPKLGDQLRRYPKEKNPETYAYLQEKIKRWQVAAKVAQLEARMAAPDESPQKISLPELLASLEKLRLQGVDPVAIDGLRKHYTDEYKSERKIFEAAAEVYGPEIAEVMKFDPAVGYPDTSPESLDRAVLEDAGLDLGEGIQPYAAFETQQRESNAVIAGKFHEIQAALQRVSQLDALGAQRTPKQSKEMKGLAASIAWLRQDALKEGLQWQSAVISRSNQMIARIQYKLSDFQIAKSNLDQGIRQLQGRTTALSSGEQAELVRMINESRDYSQQIAQLTAKKDSLLKEVEKYRLRSDSLKESISQAEDVVAEQKKQLVKFLRDRLAAPPPGTTEPQKQAWQSSLASLTAQLEKDAKRDGETGIFARGLRRLGRLIGWGGGASDASNRLPDPFGVFAGQAHSDLGAAWNSLKPDDVKQSEQLIARDIQPRAQELQGLDTDLANGNMGGTQTAQAKVDWIKAKKADLEQKKATLDGLKRQLGDQINAHETAFKRENAEANAASARLEQTAEVVMKTYQDTAPDRTELYTALASHHLLTDEMRRVNERLASGKIPDHSEVSAVITSLEAQRNDLSGEKLRLLNEEITRNQLVLRQLGERGDDYRLVKAVESRAKVLTALKDERDNLFVGDRTGVFGDDAPYEVKLERTANLLARMEPIVVAREATQRKGKIQTAIRWQESWRAQLESMDDARLLALSADQAKQLGLPEDPPGRARVKAVLLDALNAPKTEGDLRQYNIFVSMSPDELQRETASERAAREAFIGSFQMSISGLKLLAEENDKTFTSAIGELTRMDGDQSQARDRLMGYELPVQGWGEWITDRLMAINPLRMGAESARFGRETPRQLIYDKMFADQGVSLWDAYKALASKLGTWIANPGQLFTELQSVPQWAYGHPNLTRDMIGDLAHALTIATSSSDSPDHLNAVLARLRAEGIASDMLVGDRVDARDKADVPLEVLALLHLSGIAPLIAQQARYPETTLGNLARNIPFIPTALARLLGFVGDVATNAMVVEGQRAAARALPLGSDAIIDGALALYSGEDWQSVVKKYAARQAARAVATHVRDIYEDGWSSKIKNFLSFKDTKDWWKNSSTKEKVWSAITEFGVPAAAGSFLAMGLLGGPVGIVVAVLSAIAIHFAFKFINNGVFFRGTQDKINKGRAAERVKLEMAKMKGSDTDYAAFLAKQSHNLGIPEAQLEALSAEYVADKLSEVKEQQGKKPLSPDAVQASLTAAIETDIAQARQQRAADNVGRFDDKKNPQLNAVPAGQRTAFLAEMEDKIFAPGATLTREARGKIQAQVQQSQAAA